MNNNYSQHCSRNAIWRVAIQNLFLGFLLLSCAHTFLLHGWNNCWAELLGFADQSYYDVCAISYYSIIM